MTYLPYVLVKLACYAGWCWVGLRIWRSASATPLRGLGFGLLRLGIGVAAGVTIFFAVPVSSSDLFWKYIEIYSPVRLLEWFVMAVILSRSFRQSTGVRSWLWCVGGIFVSFAADLASPEGLSGHFCVGRCLC